MRLIDADALKEAMYHEAFEMDSDLQKWDSGCWIRYKMFENAIENAPTFEPERKKGKWIQTIKHHKDDEQEYDYIEVNCSECGVRRKIGWRDANYCPMCGAKMEMNDGN